MDRCHMAGEWVIGGVEAKGFAFVFVFLGLESLVRNRWNRALLLMGAAAAFHVLVGGWAAVAAALAWLWLRLPSPSGRGAGGDGQAAVVPPLASLWPGVLGGLLLALPGLLPSLMLDWGVDPQTTRQAHQIYVFERLPHHLVLTGIRPDFILRLTLLWGFWLLLGRLSAGSWHWKMPPCRNEAAPRSDESIADEDYFVRVRRLRAFVTGAVVITFLGVAIHGLIFIDRALAADLLRYYWFRMTDVALPLGVALEGTALAAGLLRRPGIPCSNARPLQWAGAGQQQQTPTRTRHRWLAFLILVAAFHLGDRTLDRIAPLPPRSHRLADFEAWHTACEWVANSGKIPPGARFLTPRLSQTFSWYTGHSAVATWKDVPQDARSMVKWWDRIQDIYATGQQPPEPRWYDPLAVRGAAQLKQLGEKYSADYVITEMTDPPLDLPVVYRNRTYVIYQLHHG
jgi:hypothetical protein